ncbi:COQ9 family protein [Loktanella sp. SALINAS62]|uniref:COQ9 family protein n=1 Tax=Loktanella sp. SALINAS62 TaxID=2706124 RepID=UPI001B8BA2C5|nr:COQ9 family protein [Loktanella sp. SALINAS62]MBS1302224.1 COQ9 family protein [Loktanella sp. SALINAS62]
MTYTDPAKLELLDAILPQVAFDGWSEEAFKAAIASTDIPAARARSLCPRGATDLAVLYHREGDRRMVEAIAADDMSGLRFSEKVARAIRLRLDASPNKEAVRRGTTLFALPHLAAEGAKLMWGTADAIWTALGDTSRDANWYTKRATLSGVWASVVLYWLGDQSVDHSATDDFIDRRIAEVMQFEKFKARVNANPLLKPLTIPLGKLAGMVRAPSAMRDVEVPGQWRKTGRES